MKAIVAPLRIAASPHRPARRRAIVCPRADLESASRATGHALGAFVVFYSSLQYAHYRRMRKAIEAKAEGDKDKRKHKAAADAADAADAVKTQDRK